MNIYTILTKKSVREILRERRFLKFYSLKDFKAGDLIEVIDGNKKSPAFVLKSETTENIRETIRSGRVPISKLKLSKTGNYKDGFVIDNFSIDDLKKYIKNPLLAHKTEDQNLKKFFPKKRPKENKTIKNSEKENKKKGSQSMADILKNKTFLKKHKVYHSEMQEMVDTIRNYFGEKNVYGMGSFPYYIGMFKQVPKRDIYQFFGEAKSARVSKSTQKRIFWFKLGKFIREKNYKKEISEKTEIPKIKKK